MKKRIGILFFAGWFLAATANADFGGSIKLPDNPSEPEKYAAELLSRVLGKSLGKDFTVIFGKAPAAPGMLISINPQPDNRQFGLEEWNIRAASARNIVISGNRLRGILFGTYEFLERFAGYRYLTIGCEIIPHRTSIEVPDNLAISGKPFFPYRRLSLGIWGDPSPFSEFYAHNRALNDSNAPKWGYRRYTGSPDAGHSFAAYSHLFAPAKDEYFSLNKQGKRQKAVNGVGPGQLCLSNPEVRRQCTELLRDFIRKDRENIDRNTPGAPYFTIYDLSQNDNTDYCVCPGCAGLDALYGGPAGALLDFINEAARNIRPEYPDIMLTTFAYQYTLNPPAGIKPEPNVMVCLANMGTDWPEAYGNREPMLSLKHPANAQALKLLEQWGELSDNLAVWDYGLHYHDSFPSPQVMVRGLFDNFEIYRRLGIKNVYNESEVFVRSIEPQSFCDLKNYIYIRLSSDPDLDGEALIADFMGHYFGPAAAPMTTLLNEIEIRQNREPGGLGRKPVQMREYLSAELFLLAEKLFAEAEKLAAGNPEILGRISQERYSFDFARLKLEYKLFPEKDFPVSREETVARLKEASEYICGKYFPEECYDPNLTRSAMLQRDMIRIAQLAPSGGGRIPERFKDCFIVADYPWQVMVVGVTEHMKIEEDPDAFGGKTARFVGSGEFKDHSKPFEIGIYDNENEKFLARTEIPRDRVPADEKYHWYKLGNVKLTSFKCRMWAHWSWGSTPVDISGVFDPLMPDQRYDFHFSLKLAGPDYVPGSRSENSSSIDRVIVTRAVEPARPPLPEWAEKLNVSHDFISTDFVFPLIGDEAAAGERTAQYVCTNPEFVNKPFALGVYDEETRKIIASTVLKEDPSLVDGKYRWYKVSNVKLTPHCRMFGHWDWKLTPIALGAVFNPEFPDRIYDIYFSVKLEGPGLSGKSSMDRIIVTWK